MTRRVFVLVSAILLSAAIAGAQDAAAPNPAGRISHLSGGVYRVDAGSQVTVFFVTGGGIVLVDPLSRNVSTWLRQELANRFPDEPVRYVVYTHHHFDRASGGGVFGKPTEHVAHDRFPSERARSAEVLPVPLASLDRNQDKRLEREELSGTASESLLTVYDRNEDGQVSPGELYSYVRAPESTYRTRRTLTLNGKSIELVYAPTAHAADMTAVYFPDERLLFAADLVPVRSLPVSIGADSSSTIASLRRIEALEFDRLLTGSGEEGSAADVGVFREYLLQLSAGVKAAFNDGLSVDDVKRQVTLDQFSNLSGFATQRENNVAEAYARLRPVLTSVYASTHLLLQRVEMEPCQAAIYDSCALTGTSPTLGGAVGVQFSVDRLTVGGEISSTQARITRRLATDAFFPPSELVFQHREMTASFLGGYRLGRAGGTQVALQGGLSLISTRQRRTSYNPDRFGQQSDGESDGTVRITSLLNPTIGGTILTPLNDRYAVVLPFRLIISGRLVNELDTPAFTFGAGLMVNVSRSSR